MFCSGKDDGPVSYLDELRREKAKEDKERAEKKANMTGPNPYFNANAAQAKKELDGMASSMKDWQDDFKRKHGRKPTLQEMRDDPTASQLMADVKSTRKDLKSSIVNRFRVK